MQRLEETKTRSDFINIIVFRYPCKSTMRLQQTWTAVVFPGSCFASYSRRAVKPVTPLFQCKATLTSALPYSVSAARPSEATFILATSVSTNAEATLVASIVATTPMSSSPKSGYSKPSDLPVSYAPVEPGLGEDADVGAIHCS